MTSVNIRVLLWMVLLGLSTAGCESKIETTVARGKSELPCGEAASDSSVPCASSSAPPAIQTSTEASTSFVVEGRTPLVVSAGDVVELTGQRFQPGLKLALNGKQLDGVEVLSDGRVSFVAPAGLTTGVLELTAMQDGVSQTISLVYNGAGDDLPIMTREPEQVCSGERYYDARGVLRMGMRQCGATPALCSADGQLGCMTSEEFAAARTAELAGKIVAGQTVAGQVGQVIIPVVPSVPAASDVRLGVSYGVASSQVGTLDPGAGVPASCANDGATGCVATSNYPAVDLIGKLTAGNVRAGVTIAGIAGNVTPAPAACSTDGATGCVAVSGFKSADMALTTVGNIRSGVTIAGVTGSVMPSAPSCSSDGMTGCVVDGTSYKAAKLANFIAADVKSGVTIAGISGGLADCAADGGTGCVAVSSYAAASTSGLASKIVSTATVGGVAGNVILPAAGKVLLGTSFGAGGVAGGTLTLPSSTAVLAGTAAYGDPDSPLTPSLADRGSWNLTAAFPGAGYFVGVTNAPLASDIRSSVTVVGVSGSVVPSPANCASDGATGCVAVASHPAATLASFAATDVRSGRTIGGIAGSLANCGLDGATSCVATSTHPAAALAGFTAGDIKSGKTIGGVAGNLADCAADGGSGCVATAGYRAAATAGLANKVIIGQTVAAQAGAVHVPLATQVVDGIAVGVSDTGTVVVPSESDVRLNATYGVDNAQVGTLDPGAGVPANCSSDGETGCVAVSSFPAVNKAVKLTAQTAKIRSSLTIAGVVGTLGDCAADGVTGCVAVATHPAAKLTNYAAGDVKTGRTIAGITGSLADCAADGATDCVSVASYKAAATSSLASKVLSTATVAGVVGNVALPAVGKVLTGTNFGVSSGSTGTLTLPSAANVRAGTADYGDPGSPVSPSMNDRGTWDLTAAFPGAGYFAGITGAPSAGDIRSSVTVNGVAGTVTPIPANCSSDAATGCVAVSSYPAARLANFSAVGIRSGQTVAGIVGSLGDCAADGTTGCVSVASYPSARLANFTAAGVRSGVTVGGITGSLGDCGVDGATGCVAVASHPAAKLANFAGGDVKSGVTIAAVAGSLANCAADGSTNCVATSTYKAANTGSFSATDVKSGKTVAGVVGSLSDCVSDGGTGCVAVSSFTAAATSGLASKVLSTATVAGVVGNVTLPAVGKVLTGTNFGVSSGSTGTLTLPSAANVRAGTADYGDPGSPVSPSMNDRGTWNLTTSFPGAGYFSGISNAPVAGDIRTSVTVNGVSGSVQAKPADCAADGSTGCVTVAGFKSANMAQAVAGNIKSGVTVAGVAGSYGTACNSDGQTNCVVSGVFKSANITGVTGWDLRAGTTLAGISGSLVFYKNMANTSLFNRNTTYGHAGADIYDTLDDYNNNGASIPSTVPTVTNGGAAVAGWQAPGSNWLRDATSDNGAGGGTASNGSCDGSEHCVYKDQITGLYWKQADATTRTWENAITHCESLNGSSYGGYSTGWRLPTQKELQQAYVDGIWGQKASTKLNLTANYYWSSSTVSYVTSNAWVVRPNYGDTDTNGKADTDYVVCVRP